MDNPIRVAFYAGSFLLFVIAMAIAISMFVAGASNDLMNGTLGIVAIVVATAVTAGIYFLPTYLAYQREHRNLVPLAIINVGFGWTFIGWVGSLAWAFYEDGK